MEGKETSTQTLGFTDPPRTRWLGFSPALIQLAIAFPVAGVAVGAMYEGAVHASDPRGIAVMLFGATALTTVLLLLIGVGRDVRAKDAGRRLEVRLERIIELQVSALEQQHPLASIEHARPPRSRAPNKSVRAPEDE